MTTLDLRPRSLILATDSSSKSQPARRLIVLVPDLQVDIPIAAHRIWELADAMHARVHFLGVYSDEAQEPGIRRQAVTLSAMVSDARVTADAEVVFGNDWVDVVRSRLQSGDLVVCFAEKRVGLLGRPLSQILQAQLDIPLYILSGLHPQDDSQPNWRAQMAVWTGSIVIIIGFFVLQARIDHLAKDSTPIVLQLLSIPVEVWLLWVWNSLWG